MKTKPNYAFTLLALLLLPVLAVAQDSDEDSNTESTESSSSLGLEVGASAMVNMNAFTDPEVESAFGYGAGAFATYPVLDILSVGLELNYSSYGGDLNDYTTNYDVLQYDMQQYTERNVIFHSLNIPLYAIMDLDPFKAYAGASYTYNFAVFEKRDIEYSAEGQNSLTFINDYENVGSRYKKYNVALVAGGMYDFGAFRAGARYEHGLVNLNAFNSYAQPNSGGASQFKTRLITINVQIPITTF